MYEKEEEPNRDRVAVAGTGPVRLFPETLKECRSVWFSGGREPLNPFHSSRRVSRRSSLVRAGGSRPEKLLKARSRTLRR